MLCSLDIHQIVRIPRLLATFTVLQTTARILPSFGSSAKDWIVISIQQSDTVKIVHVGTKSELRKLAGVLNGIVFNDDNYGDFLNTGP